MYTACWRLIHKSGPNSPPTHTLKHSPTLVYDSFSYTGLRNHGNLDHTVIAQRTTVRCLCYPSVRLIHFTTVFFCECFFVHYFWVHPQKSTKERERTGQDVDSFFTLLLFTFSLPPRTNFGSLNLFVLIVCRRCYYCCCFSTLFIQLFLLSLFHSRCHSRAEHFKGIFRSCAVPPPRFLSHCCFLSLFSEEVIAAQSTFVTFSMNCCCLNGCFIKLHKLVYARGAHHTKNSNFFS